MKFEELLSDKNLCEYGFCANGHIYFKFLDTYDKAIWNRNPNAYCHQMIYVPIKIENQFKDKAYTTLGNFIISRNDDLSVLYNAVIQNCEQMINVVTLKKL